MQITMSVDDRTRVIERLKVSKTRLKQSLYDEGHCQGFRWAKDHGEIEGLKSLEELREISCDQEWDDFFEMAPDECTVDEWLAMQLQGSWRGGAVDWSDRRAASEFWEDKRCEPDYLKESQHEVLKL